MRATSDWLSTWTRFTPDAEALFDLGTGRRWTYAALRQESLSWAGTLAARGVGPGDRVAVLALNRGETLALLFACSHLGAVLFPMNWRLAPAEQAWQLSHSTPAVLIHDGEQAERAAALVAGSGIAALSMEDGPDADAPVPVASERGSDLDDPWQLMYTSGTSGRPKGALLTHRQVHWNALNTVLACDLRPGDSTLTFAPLFHTGGLNCLTTPLLHRGGRVVLVPRLDPAQALDLVASEGITHLMGVPTIYQLLADAPAFGTTDLGSVRDAICGGAPLGRALLERYLDRGIPLRQGFGLTEVGPNCFSTPHDQVREKLGTVGVPIHHVEARVVRPDGTPCDTGEPGELLLRGPVVCGGYWRDPEATAGAIVDGWFHTGDVLSVDEDGYFTVRGRRKEMFISGGENVYPAEVEAAIQAHPAVAVCAVIGVEDARWGEVGRAFVELSTGAAAAGAGAAGAGAAGSTTPVDTAALRGWLSDRLARFKIPKHWELVTTLPRTGSGKIDKPALSLRPLSEAR